MPGCSLRALPFSAPCNDMLVMLVCATCWLYMHLYTLTHMFMHKSCLIVCRPCFNTMKSWKFDPNLHLSPVDTTFCLFACLFACFLALLAFLFVCLSCCLSCLLPHAMLCSFSCLFDFTFFCLLSYYACHVYHAYLLYASFIHFLHLFFPLLVCWFLIFAFACTHMNQGCMELGYNFPSASKRGADASM